VGLAGEPGRADAAEHLGHGQDEDFLGWHGVLLPICGNGWTTDKRMARTLRIRLSTSAAAADEKRINR
jgi:hypothetical protein